jgi:hypothetical protein
MLEKAHDFIQTIGIKAGRGRGKVFHTMEEGFAGFSTQWKAVSENFPHNGSMFRGFFHTMETCFAAVFHGVEEEKA